MPFTCRFKLLIYNGFLKAGLALLQPFSNFKGLSDSLVIYSSIPSTTLSSAIQATKSLSQLSFDSTIATPTRDVP